MPARTPRLVNPQSVVSCLAGLKGNSPLGLPPLVPSDPHAHDKAELALRERAQRALHDLRSIALCHLDKEFIAAIRPSHPDAAAIFDAGIDAMGYAAFFQSKYQEYPGIHINLGALHQYLLRTPEIPNYDLQAFLTVLRAAREALPDLAARTAVLEPLLTDQSISKIFRRRDPDYTKIIRRIDEKRQQFAKFFGRLSDFDEALAGFFPLLLQDPDETPLNYREMMERIRAVRERRKHTDAEDEEGDEDTEEDKGKKKKKKIFRGIVKQHASLLRPKRKPGVPPSLHYYRGASKEVVDRISRGQDFLGLTVPNTIKELYEQHGLGLAREQAAWRRFAKETWAGKSAMRWTMADEGIRSHYLAQRVANPLGALPEDNLIEEVQRERETIVTILVNLSYVGDYELTYMVADRFGDFLTKGGVPTEIIGYTTLRGVVPDVVGRNRPVHYVILKTRQEPHNLATVHRLCTILHPEMRYFSYDGEAIMFGCDRIMKSSAKRWIVFVVSDSKHVSGTYMSKRGEDISYFVPRHFRDAVARIEAEKEVVIVGISIKNDLSRIFSRCMQVNSIRDIYSKLSPSVLALLREYHEHDRLSVETRLDPEIVARRKARLWGPKSSSSPVPGGS
jgi:cobalamin biosynthesis protein CobT